MKQQYKTHSASICLKNDTGVRQNRQIGRIVLSAFKPQPQYDDLFAIHKDCNPHNNQVSNLEWLTMAAIVQARKKRGTYGQKAKVQLTMFDHDKIIDSRICTSVTDCHNIINNFFDGKISRCCPIDCTTIVDPAVDSHKKCTVQYCDQSRNITKVHNIANDEKRKMFNQGKRKQQHFISNYGRTKVVYMKNGREKILKQRLMNGYWTLVYRKSNQNNQTRVCSTGVHRLVAKYFVPNPHNLGCIDHIDSDPTNNHVTNLRWVMDQRENCKNPKTIAKKIIQTPVIQVCKTTNQEIRTWPNSYEVQRQLGFSSLCIRRCCENKQKTSYGYVWRFETNS